MKKLIVLVSLCVVMLVLTPRSGFSESLAPLVEPAVGMSVNLQKMEKDDRGTDVENIYTITVDYSGSRAEGKTYNILYYLDGVYVEEFKGLMLPYSFTRNFKGQTDKAHEIRIDLEDKKLRIVGRQVASVNVVHVNGQ